MKAASRCNVMESRPDHLPAYPLPEASLPEPCLPVARKCFAATSAGRWQLSFRVFQAALARSAAKRFGNTAIAAAEFEKYSSSLHLQDLALACACSEGSEVAWEEFVSGYRGYLRAASAAIMRCSASDPSAVELADSLFTDLFGLSERNARSHSLFRYFHGRSSLKTWLRAVLAQRHIDQIRAGKKFDSLDDQPADGASRRIPEPATVELPADPRREQYLQRFREALTGALAALDPRDRTRLHLHYAEGRTLAEIGRALGEHESSVSRNLERVRKELRATVEGLLRAGTAAANGSPAVLPAVAGLDDAQVTLCIQYAAEDAAIDLDRLFNAQGSQISPGRNRTVKP
jgi:RNA polymerase sigma-70 factor, ECF subfamily